MNLDFDGSRKEFWAFVGRRMKGKGTPLLLYVGLYNEYKGYVGCIAKAFGVDGAFDDD